MSQSLWQIGRPDLNVCVFFFVFFFNVFFFFFPSSFFLSFLSSRHVKFGSVTTLFSMKYGTWFLDEQDTRQNTEFKKSVVQSVLLCLSCLFMYSLTSKFKKKKKKIEKKLSKQKKIKSLNFAKSNADRKTNARGSFETYN